MSIKKAFYDLHIVAKLVAHDRWCKNQPGGARANLCGADLRGADLRGADLREANLCGANLYGVNLYRADLRGADLREANLYKADLRGADLRGADLRGANLYKADLYEANLCEADLRGADLRGANLCEADLRGADLRGAKYNLLTVMSANWFTVSNKLCVEMMKWDAASHPHPEKFQEWASGESCPLNSSNVERLFLFREDRDLYEAGPPTMTLWQLWTEIAKEKELKI